jgi:hypothetical protein
MKKEMKLIRNKGAERLSCLPLTPPVPPLDIHASWVLPSQRGCDCHRSRAPFFIVEQLG